MQSLTKLIILAVLFCSFSTITHAQKKSEKLEVRTQLTEKQGDYDQRKLYRKFLTSYMDGCPYISHFSVQEENHSNDNHQVVWYYEVNDWKDITAFYHWLAKRIKSDKKSGLLMAMTPFKPDYDLGEKIQVSPIKKGKLAKQ